MTAAFLFGMGKGLIKSALIFAALNAVLFNCEVYGTYGNLIVNSMCLLYLFLGINLAFFNEKRFK